MKNVSAHSPSLFSAHPSLVRELLDRTIRLVGFTALLVIPLVFQPRMYTAYTDVKRAMIEFIALLCLLLIFIRVVTLTSTKRMVRLRVFPLLLLVYAAINLLSLITAVNLQAGLWNCAVVLACLVMAFWAYRQSSRPASVLAIIHLLASTVIGIALYGFLQYNGIDIVHLELPRLPVSTMGNLNFTAQYLIGTIPLFVSAFVLARRMSARLFFLAALILAVVHLLLTQSRGGLVGFAVSAVLFSILYAGAIGSPVQHLRNFLRTKAQKLLIICLGSIIVVTSYCILDSGKTLDRLVSIFTTRKETNIYRLLTWRDTMRLVAHYPILGVGVGNYQFVFPLYKSEQLWHQQDIFGRTRQVRTHNDYLNILAETGVLGLATFLTIVGVVVVGSLRQCTSKHAPLAKRTILQIGLLSGICATLAQSLFDFNLYNPASALLFWVSLGLLAGLAGTARSANFMKTSAVPEAQKRPGMYLAFAGIALLGLMSLYSTFVFRPYSASYDNQQAQKYFDRRDYTSALNSLQRAIDIDRTNIDTVSLLADTYRNMGNYDNARRYYEQWLSLEPHYPPIYNRLGFCYMQLGDYARAAEAFHTAVAINPVHAAALSNLGNLYLAAGEYEKAAEYLERTNRIESNVSRRNRRNLAVVLMHLDRYDEAITILNKISHDEPDNLDILEMMVTCYRVTGNIETADALERRITILGSARELQGDE